MAVIFTSKDIDYLVLNFSLRQLRHEHHNAELQASTASHNEFEDAFYWKDYTEALQFAIDIRQSNLPRPKPTPGRVDLESLKANTDIVAVVERYTELRQSGSRFTGRCPLHQDKHPSLFVYPDQNSWYCFQCNQGGDVITLTMAVENTDFRGAVAILEGR